MESRGRTHAEAMAVRLWFVQLMNTPKITLSLESSIVASSAEKDIPESTLTSPNTENGSTKTFEKKILERLITKFKS